MIPRRQPTPAYAGYWQQQHNGESLVFANTTSKYEQYFKHGVETGDLSAFLAYLQKNYPIFLDIQIKYERAGAAGQRIEPKKCKSNFPWTQEMQNHLNEILGAGSKEIKKLEDQECNKQYRCLITLKFPRDPVYIEIIDNESQLPKRHYYDLIALLAFISNLDKYTHIKDPVSGELLEDLGRIVYDKQRKQKIAEIIGQETNAGIYKATSPIYKPTVSGL